jgi:hypothetical protein
VRATPGRRYRIDRGDVLGIWTPWTEITATAAGVAVTDAAGTGGNRFYRVVEL